MGINKVMEILRLPKTVVDNQDGYCRGLAIIENGKVEQLLMSQNV
jgi:hypothetical protein